MEYHLPLLLRFNFYPLSCFSFKTKILLSDDLEDTTWVLIVTASNVHRWNSNDRGALSLQSYLTGSRDELSRMITAHSEKLVAMTIELVRLWPQSILREVLLKRRLCQDGWQCIGQRTQCIQSGLIIVVFHHCRLRPR